MSYDIRLEKNGQELLLKEKHHFAGGTYALGGTKQAWLNVTYNYSNFFYDVLGEKGIRTIYGMTAEESIPVILEAEEKLEEDKEEDYWKSTSGNARRALVCLRLIAELAVEQGDGDAKWEGD